MDELSSQLSDISKLPGEKIAAVLRDYSVLESESAFLKGMDRMVGVEEALLDGEEGILSIDPVRSFATYVSALEEGKRRQFLYEFAAVVTAAYLYAKASTERGRSWKAFFPYLYLSPPQREARLGRASELFHEQENYAVVFSNTMDFVALLRTLSKPS